MQIETLEAAHKAVLDVIKEEHTKLMADTVQNHDREMRMKAEKIEMIVNESGKKVEEAKKAQ